MFSKMTPRFLATMLVLSSFSLEARASECKDLPDCIGKLSRILEVLREKTSELETRPDNNLEMESVLKGAILPFGQRSPSDGRACPRGWSPIPNSQGAVLVGGKPDGSDVGNVRGGEWSVVVEKDNLPNLELSVPLIVLRGTAERVSDNNFRNSNFLLNQTNKNDSNIIIEGTVNTESLGKGDPVKIDLPRILVVYCMKN